MSESSKTEKYVKVGNYVLERKNEGFILPPIFYHTAVERPEDSENTGYKRRVEGAEREYVVFKAFEQLLKDEPSLIVLHSLKITKKHLKDLDIDRINIFGKNEAGSNQEHDFIAVDKVNRRFIAVEVKTQSKREKGKLQLDRIERFIKEICPDFHLVKVLAFPSDTNSSKHEGQYKELFHDCFVTPSAFSLWWKKISEYFDGQHENSIGQYRNSVVQPEIIDEQAKNIDKRFDRAIKLLIGLWADTNKESEIEIIKMIDDRLKRAILYQGNVKDKSNMTSNTMPLMKPPGKATVEDSEVGILEMIHIFLKIKSLTSKQLSILTDLQRKQCIIRGPAGCGKTILMLAQIIRLTNVANKRPIGIIAHAHIPDVKTTLEECNLKVKVLPLEESISKLTLKYFDNKISLYCEQTQWLRLCDVLIIYPPFMHTQSHRTFKDYNLKTFLDPLSPFHLFVDNLQHSHFLELDLAATVPMLKDLTKYLWLLCDDMQHYDSDWLDMSEENKAHDQVIVLRDHFEEQILMGIVRNTFEISEASIAMRKHSMEVNPLEIQCKTFHLIHGPRPRLCVITKFDGARVIEKREKFKERYTDQNTSLGVLSNFNVLIDFTAKDNIKFKGFVFRATPYEFTAVLGLLDMRNVDSESQSLKEQWFYTYSYSILSRARVVAEIILIRDEGFVPNRNLLDKYFEVEYE